jgi:Icc-related predicted phosphoesterase
MRVFAVSDLHVDYPENDRWVSQISLWDHQSDVLLCPGDISQNMPFVVRTLERLRRCFREVVYVPGNHELWVTDGRHSDSIARFHDIMALAADCGVHTGPLVLGGLALVPLFAWYDFSFGRPSQHLLDAWVDFHACRWPGNMDAPAVAEYFSALNRPNVRAYDQPVISFSHFVPRRELLPRPESSRAFLSPVLGSEAIDAQVRQLGSMMHVYGHYHVNRRHEHESVTYINNAYGYPSEKGITAKALVCIFENGDS